MRVPGLGYDAEYFTLDGHDVVHAAVPHVDHQVRAVAPVWLPHVAPVPLCGLGRRGATRRMTSPRNGLLCRACRSHLRDLDEWVRLAEQHLTNSNGHANGNGAAAPARVGASQRHTMPF